MPAPNFLQNRKASWDLAHRIENYWHSRGYLLVRAWVESVYDNGDAPYQIRSNIRFAPHE